MEGDSILGHLGLAFANRRAVREVCGNQALDAKVEIYQFHHIWEKSGFTPKLLMWAQHAFIEMAALLEDQKPSSLDG